MQPLAIIEPFDKRKDLPARLIPRVIGLVVDELVLQGAEEALRHRVVIAVALPTHARRDAQVGESPLIQKRTVLRTLIGVMNEAGPNPPLAHGHRDASSVSC